MRNSKFQITNNKRGFTLIELMTAVSIFTIVMAISLGSIVGIFHANRKARTMKTAMSNLNLAMESMAKEMRFGRVYHCGSSGQESSPQNCSGGGTFMSFMGNDSAQITYRFNNQALEKKIGNGSYITVTAPELIIDTGTFYTVGSGTGDTLQPKVLIIIKAHAGTDRSRSDMVLQTLVSQRALDI